MVSDWSLADGTAFGAVLAALYKKFLNVEPTPDNLPEPAVFVFEGGAAINTRGSGITTATSGPDTIVTGGTVDTLEFLDTDGATVLATLTFDPVPATAVFDALAADNIDALFDFLVTLVDDDTTVTGADGAEEVFVGAGNDTASMGDGDDTIAKSDAGDLVFDGGAGSDTLSFRAEIGDAFPNAPVRQLVVDLAAGTGQNPYGGTLTLTGVENIAGIPEGFGADITGNDAANFIGDDVGTGVGDINDATIGLRGGDDTLAFGGGSGNIAADGGTGTDTLIFEDLGGGTHFLDLADPANNAGGFAGGTFTGFEVFEVEVFFGGAFDFAGSDWAEQLSFAGRDSTLDVAMGGGDDTFILKSLPSGGATTAADGGAGMDTLIFETQDFDPDTAVSILDLTDQTNNSGAFDGRTFTGFC